jgi:hypothetical protein
VGSPSSTPTTIIDPPTPIGDVDTTKPTPNSYGIIAGVVIGGVLFLGAIVAVFIIVLRRKRNQTEVALLTAQNLPEFQPTTGENTGPPSVQGSIGPTAQTWGPPGQTFSPSVSRAAEMNTAPVHYSMTTPPGVVEIDPGRPAGRFELSGDSR